MQFLFYREHSAQDPGRAVFRRDDPDAAPRDPAGSGQAVRRNTRVRPQV